MSPCLPCRSPMAKEGACRRATPRVYGSTGHHDTRLSLFSSLSLESLFSDSSPVRMQNMLAKIQTDGDGRNFHVATQNEYRFVVALGRFDAETVSASHAVKAAAAVRHALMETLRLPVATIQKRLRRFAIEDQQLTDTDSSDPAVTLFPVDHRAAIDARPTDFPSCSLAHITMEIDDLRRAIIVMVGDVQLWANGEPFTRYPDAKSDKQNLTTHGRLNGGTVCEEDIHHFVIEDFHALTLGSRDERLTITHDADAQKLNVLETRPRTLRSRYQKIRS